MLRSRIYRRVRFAPMAPETVLEVIPNYHPLYHGVAPELLALVDDRYAHGCFREWASFTHGALALACERGEDALSEQLARAVLELHAAGKLEDAA
jgi:hypothetical protein